MSYGHCSASSSSGMPDLAVAQLAAAAIAAARVRRRNCSAYHRRIAILLHEHDGELREDLETLKRCPVKQACPGCGLKVVVTHLTVHPGAQPEPRYSPAVAGRRWAFT
jgi:hypothetical protein